jgi:hypothetical protein
LHPERDFILPMPRQALLILLLLLPACRDTTPRAREFDGASAFPYIETQVGFGPRVPGTEAHHRAAAWLDSLLRQRADTVVVQSWTHVTAAGDSLPLSNCGPIQPGA